MTIILLLVTIVGLATIFLLIIYLRRSSSPTKEKMEIVYELERKEYDYGNKFHSFMKTDKGVDKIPQPKLSLNPKIKKSLTIGVCVRDCEKHMKLNLSKIEQICNLFEYSNIIFYENASDDNSFKILQNYCNKNKHCVLIHEEYNTSEYPRTVRLARARNICLNFAKAATNDIYIALDFDDVIKELTPDNIALCFDKNIEWGALFANQKGEYYDLWALRTYDDWMKYDCWEAADIIGVKNAFDKHQRTIPANSIIQVISAFGGTGIYKLPKTKGCYYYGWKNNRECCEHVHFHKQMNKQSNLYIIGELINH